MWKKKKCTCLLIFILFSITVTFPGSLGGPSSYRQKPRKPVTNGTIITTRFGDDGSPKEQCQCISFWLCDATKLYDDPNDPKYLYILHFKIYLIILFFCTNLKPTDEYAHTKILISEILVSRIQLWFVTLKKIK